MRTVVRDISPRGGNIPTTWRLVFVASPMTSLHSAPRVFLNKWKRHRTFGKRKPNFCSKFSTRICEPPKIYLWLVWKPKTLHV